VLGAASGYVGDREYLKYEVRSAFHTAFSGVVPNSVAQPPSPPVHNAEPSPVELTLLKKGFKPHDIHADDFEDDVTFEISIRNTSSSDIRAFDGLMQFTDLLGNQIINMKLAINDPVKSGATMNWEGALKYNQFIDAHQRLRDAPRENLKMVFVPRKVLFADGKTKDYD
jgi:hypothetical protein